MRDFWIMKVSIITWPNNLSHVLFIILFSDLSQGWESYEVASDDACNLLSTENGKWRQKRFVGTNVFFTSLKQLKNGVCNFEFKVFKSVSSWFLYFLLEEDVTIVCTECGLNCEISFCQFQSARSEHKFQMTLQVSNSYADMKRSRRVACYKFRSWKTGVDFSV